MFFYFCWAPGRSKQAQCADFVNIVENAKFVIYLFIFVVVAITNIRQCRCVSVDSCN